MTIKVRRRNQKQLFIKCNSEGEANFIQIKLAQLMNPPENVDIPEVKVFDFEGKLVQLPKPKPMPMPIQAKVVTKNEKKEESPKKEKSTPDIPGKNVGDAPKLP